MLWCLLTFVLALKLVTAATAQPVGDVQSRALTPDLLSLDSARCQKMEDGLTEAPGSYEGYLTAGLCAYLEEEYATAVEHFRAAIRLQPGSAVAWQWLGRAFGRLAETSSFFRAPGYARRARDAFEQAVALAPEDPRIVSDLFEYYLQAPGFLGGDQGKAERLAKRFERRWPAYYAYLMAKLSVKRKKYQLARQYFEKAIQLEPDKFEYRLDYAKFLYRHNHIQEAEAHFTELAARWPDTRRLLRERARVYVESGKNLELAKALLEQYLQGPVGLEDGPRSEAVKLLQKAQSGLAKTGD